MTKKALSAWLEPPRPDNRGRLHYRAAWHERQPDGALKRRRQSLWALGIRTQEQAEAWVARKNALLNNVPEALPNVTARVAFDEYLADFRFRANLKTQQETRLIVDRFLSCSGAGPRPLSEITKGVIVGYLNGRLSGTPGHKPIAAATRDAELRVLAAAFRRMCKPPFEFIGSDPTAGLLPLLPPTRAKGETPGRLRRTVGRVVHWLRRGLGQGRR